MSPPPRYIRLFDINKYREIQPVTDGINKRRVDLSQATKLVETALDLVHGKEFQRYHSESSIEYFISEIKDGLEIIKEGDLSNWYAHDGSDKLNMIISTICCPRYQFYSDNHETDSDTTLSYLEYTRDLYFFNERLYNMLQSYELEVLPSDNSDEAAVWIFTTQDMAEITEMVVRDLDILSQLNNVLYWICSRSNYMKVSSTPPQVEDLNPGDTVTAEPETQAGLINFYRKFNHIINIANSNQSYTIVNETFG
jgi:hypothetical protein